MNITAIKAQAKNTNRVSVFIDGKYAFSLSHSQLLEEQLSVGLEIGGERLRGLQKASDFGKFWERVLGYALLRPRSRHEVETYCRRRKVNAQDCQAAIQKLSRLGYLNDQAFARSWVQSRRLTKPTSKRKLQAELQQKGVAEAIIAEVLAGGEDHEQDALKQLIAKKQRLARFQKDPQKLIAYLARQGFSYEDIKRQLKLREAVD